jgi:CDP-diacylglycerol--glycerol-3-phosphate 3-phosphatidyltransferase
MNIPNLLSLSRLPLAVVLFVCIHHEAWFVGLVVFCVAGITDWADGFLARRWNQQTAVGRSLDPLTDKVLLNGAFIFFIPVLGAGVEPWMVAVIVGRELLVTGLRGMVEATGAKFAADWFGKLKTILQFAVIIALLLLLSMRAFGWLPATWDAVEAIVRVLLWAMLVATVGSGLQYCGKAWKVLR